MCTIIAKKFPNIGWIGVKNRDRSSPTSTNLLRKNEKLLQRVTLVDDNTKWSEGTNSKGVSIISSSLTPIRLDKHDEHISKDGHLISIALSQPTVYEAIKSLHDHHIVGCVMIFDSTQLWLIEGKNGTKKQVIREVKDDAVARTNHGIWIPTAGYTEYTNDPILRMRRISSEARLEIANHIADVAKTPSDLLVLLAKEWVDNSQLTTLRKPGDIIKTRTTEQLMIIPKYKTLIVRNTNGVLDFNKNSADNSHNKVKIRLLD